VIVSLVTCEQLQPSYTSTSRCILRGFGVQTLIIALH